VNKRNKLLALAVVIALAGCGGDDNDGLTGGDDNEGSTSPPAAVADYEGLYVGVTSEDRELLVIALADGSFSAIYVSQRDPDINNGLILGRVTASGASLSSSEVIDYNMSKTKISPATLSATYTPKQALNGTLSYPNAGGRAVTFTTRYDSAYEKAPTLASRAGSYSSPTSILGRDMLIETDITITETGGIAMSFDACKATGTLVPRTSINVYTLTLQFAAAKSCPYASQTLTGVAYPVDENGYKGINMLAGTADASNALIIIADEVKPGARSKTHRAMAKAAVHITPRPMMSLPR